MSEIVVKLYGHAQDIARAEQYVRELGLRHESVLADKGRPVDRARASLVVDLNHTSSRLRDALTGVAAAIEELMVIETLATEVTRRDAGRA